MAEEVSSRDAVHGRWYLLRVERTRSEHLPVSSKTRWALLSWSYLKDSWAFHQFLDGGVGKIEMNHREDGPSDAKLTFLGGLEELDDPKLEHQSLNVCYRTTPWRQFC